MRSRAGKLFLRCGIVAMTVAGGLPSPAREWIVGDGFRYQELAVAPGGKTHLTEVSSNETGIAFRSDVAEERGAQNSIRMAGTGVAAGDVDGDGWCDLFFCSMGGRSALYRNLGNWRFEEITASAGVACEGQDSTGASLADLDGDGDLDLLVNSIGGGTRLFLNDGHGHFTESTECGFSRRSGSISMTLADVNGDGFLDVYVVNYAASKIEDRPNTRFETRTINGQIVITALDGIPTTSQELTNRYYVDADHSVRELGEADTLYLNDGHGKFVAASWLGGSFLDEDGRPLARPPNDWGLSAMFRDLNSDSAPDLYVCNDLFTPDRIWINDGKGHFRLLPWLAIRQTSLFSMGVDFADINRDGFEDFIVLDMLSPSLADQKVQIIGMKPPTLPIGKFLNRPQYKKNTLMLNRGDGTYAEVGQLSGLDATGWSWSPVFLDVDLDGYEDLLVSAGYYRDALNADAVTRMRALQGKRKLSDQEFRELKKNFPTLPQPNKLFRNRGDLTFEDKSSEWGFDFNGISQGICLADLDNDGDQDVILVRQNAPVAIYRNESSEPRVAVRLRGVAPNTRGVSAKLRLKGGAVAQSQEMISGGRYLCSDDPMRTFAARAGNDMEIEVNWRSGARSIVKNVKANRLYEIDEQKALKDDSPNHPPVPTMFDDASLLLAHQHQQPDRDDFAAQPTLPRKISQAGPGVAWIDVDGDGIDDLVIGAGSGSPATFFKNLGMSGFQAITNNLSSSWSGKFVDIPSVAFATAAADIDGDGDIDFFRGGGVEHGKYPVGEESFIYVRESEGRTNSISLGRLGIVNGAVFSDLNNDGFPELVVACEWGPIRVFRNERGRFIEATESLGFSKFTGLWNGIAAGDFDGDGRMDLVASNWGRNTKFERFRGAPLRIYFGDQSPVCLLASFDPVARRWLSHSSFSAVQRALPSIVERIPDFKSFGNASVEQILGSDVPNPKFVEAAVLDSMVFLNRGDHFESVPLPIDAQVAPAFGVTVADFDGDGVEDIFLAQNFFAVDGNTARYDAGRGLLLKGRGDGTFSAVPGQVSGITLYGEQRASAAADYDADGRTDLVVTQNGATTILLRNRTAPPGLRVKLKGRKGNELAIGAGVRLVANGKLGPMREIHAGSGYHSQDSGVAVLCAASQPTSLWVRWPGGATNNYPIAAGTKQIEVSP